MSATSIKDQLLAYANPKKAEHSKRFFRTATGEYGEGDRFIGATVPEIRSVSRAHKNVLLRDIGTLLKDPIHECRLLAVILLVQAFSKADDAGCKELFDFYIRHKEWVNNWDIVDSSAHQIVGEYLQDNDRSILDTFARSNHLWTQRISIVATYAFIKKGEVDDTFRIAELLLSHQHDLIHKAVGWMLREAGKKEEKALKAFLKKHYNVMPRTMLRYAIEKFPINIRKCYLKGQV